MIYLSVAETAARWQLSERSVRNYCASGRIPEAVLVGKTWKIPNTAKKPERVNKRADDSADLLSRLKAEKDAHVHGGVYHRVQIDLTYNSNHIEGSRLTHEQTRFIFETNTIGADGVMNVDDVVETANHFRCIDMVIDNVPRMLTESFIKQLHAVLKNGTTDSRKSWFAVGDYKKLPNEVGLRETVEPERVADAMKALLRSYRAEEAKQLDDLLDFHYRFERIHPFQDGNGRVGRLILFKECLRNEIVPFIITDELKPFYDRGLQNWETEKGFLRDTCLTAQDAFKKMLDYFRIRYDSASN